MKLSVILLPLNLLLSFSHVVPHNTRVPYQVAIRVFVKNEKTSQLCGGTIIDKSWILTAAHCLHPFSNLEKVFVIAGTVDLPKVDTEQLNQMWVKLPDILLHPQYDALRMRNDIALIKLPRPLDLFVNMLPAKLPRRGCNDTYTGQTATISGYGITQNMTISKKLQFADVKVVDNKECQAEWSKRLDRKKILPTFICIDPNKGKLPCTGDSGGPLAIRDKETTIIGVISHGFDLTCQVKISDIFTRVSCFVDWIESHTGRLNYTTFDYR